MIPFHVPTIPKPQDCYGIKPDNSNTSFVQPAFPDLLLHSSASNLVHHPPSPDTPIEPDSLQSTPFTYIDTLQGLKCLQYKLEGVDEFAVDLEANSYRSFQGLTCLMQISTRTEDFVVDTLKLYHSIGKYLGGVFLAPTKRKVMHGAANDVLWLQRDFGIFVCNLFDTMQASRVLKLERNSLAHLLVYFCRVFSNKQYQTSDWRIRPLPRQMLHYAREDTHYLLYIYDKMRSRLVAGCGSSENDDDPLLEVYSRSHNICKTLYEKELFKEDSYEDLFGLGDAGLDSDQTNVAARLYKWRDRIARENDESTGYVLPNKLLLEFCQKLPKTDSELLSIAEAHKCQNHPFILKYIGELLKIIGNLDGNQIVAQIDNSKQNAKPEDANLNKRSHLEMQYMYQMNRPQGYYVTAVYPQACYVNAVYPPGYYLSAKRPVLMNPVYCTVPQYYQYQIC